MTQIPEDYDSWTVPQVEEYLEESDLSEKELDSVQKYERNHQDRSGVADAIAEERDDDHADDTDSDVISVVEPISEEPETVTVTLDDGLRVSVAGLLFNDPSGEKEVEYTPRIQEAVEDGYLKIQE